MSRNNSAKKPYCKVCHDAGKTEIEYKSHWVKDMTGKTTCPTLLNTECRFCYKTGHTTKFCKELEKLNKNKERIERKVEKPNPKPTTVKNKPVNKFSAFQCDSDSEGEEEVNKSWPSVVCQEIPPVKKEGSWATIAAKPLVLTEKTKPLNPYQGQGMVVLTKRVMKSVKVPESKPLPAPWSNIEKAKPIMKKSWADCSEDEDEDEDEESEEELDYGQVEDGTW